MHIKPIKTDTDYRHAFSGIEKLMHAPPKTPDGGQLDILVTLVKTYETIEVPLRSTRA